MPNDPKLEDYLPKPNAVVASTTTLTDFMRKSFKLEVGGQGTNYAVVSRMNDIGHGGHAVEPDVVVVGGDGILRRMRPIGGGLGWREERVEVEALRGGGAQINYVAAVAQNGPVGEERLMVAIAATRGGSFFFEVMERSNGQWSRIDLPAAARGAKELSLTAVATGRCISRGVKMLMQYVCLRGRGPFLFGAGNAGEGIEVEMPSGLTDRDHLATIPGFAPISVMRVSDHSLYVYPGTLRNNRLDIDFGTVGITPLPDDPCVKDASQIVPMLNADNECAGVLVRTGKSRLYGVSGLGKTGKGKAKELIRGAAGEPNGVKEVACSYSDMESTFIYVLDHDGSVWFAEWSHRKLLEKLSWQPTGCVAQSIRAPQCQSGRTPYVFTYVDGRLDCISRVSDGDTWAREALTVAPASEEVEKTLLHAVSLAAVTVQGEPVSGTKMYIGADRPVVVEFEGQLRRLSTTESIQVVSGPGGHVGLKLRAEALDMAELRVQTAFGEYRFRPHEAALSRLAQPGVVTAQSLEQAGLLPPGTQRAEEVADLIRNAAAQIIGTELGNTPRHLNRSPYAVQPPRVEEVSLTIVRTDAGFVVAPPGARSDGAPAKGRRKARATVELSPAAFWSRVRAAWKAVEAISAKIVGATVEFVVTIAGEMLQCVARAGRTILEGIEAMLTKLSKELAPVTDMARKLVSLVAETLGWDDVIRCKNLASGIVLKSLIDLENAGRSLSGSISGKLNEMRDRLDKAIDDTIGELGGAGAFPGAKVKTDQRRGDLQRHSGKAMLVQNAVPTGGGKEGIAWPKPTDQLQEKLAQLSREADALTERADLKAAIRDIAALVEGKTSLDELLPVLGAELLRKLKVIIRIGIGAIDTLQTLLFEVVTGVISLVRKILDMPLVELGPALVPLNKLYQAITGEQQDCTLLDIAMLIMVTPGVVLYHILKPGAPLCPPQEIGAPVTLLDAVAATDPQARQIVYARHKASAEASCKAIRWISALWTIIRFAPANQEKTHTFLTLETGSTLAGLASAIPFVLMSIADYGPLLWQFLFDPTLNAYGKAIFDWIVANRDAYLIYLLTILVPIAAGMKIVFMGSAALSLVLSSALSAFAGIAKILLQFLLVGWRIAQGGSPTAKELASFWAARWSGIVLGVRGLSTLTMPVGYGLYKFGDPATKGVGLAIYGSAYAFDVIGYVGGGTLLLLAENLNA